MKNLAILCGGESPEHEISLLSADNVFQAVDKKKYRAYLFGITKNGRLVHHPELILHAKEATKIHLNPKAEECSFHFGKIGAFPIDVVFPILHGVNGEDGVVQGVLKFFHFPYVGAGVKSSAIGMDKEISKILVSQFQIPVAPYLSLRKEDPNPNFSDILTQWNQRVFVKPSNSGSSVGVSLCTNEQELEEGIKKAFAVDNKILIEQGIVGRELEVGVLKWKEKTLSSYPAEIKTRHSFYSYEAKYIDPHATDLILPAKLEKKAEKRIQELALLVFKALEMDSLARVDFFMEEKGEIIFNEINTMPGFTNRSLYPRMLQFSNFSYTDLISTLVEEASCK